MNGIIRFDEACECQVMERIIYAWDEAEGMRRDGEDIRPTASGTEWEHWQTVRYEAGEVQEGAELLGINDFALDDGSYMQLPKSGWIFIKDN